MKLPALAVTTYVAVPPVAAASATSERTRPLALKTGSGPALAPPSLMLCPVTSNETGTARLLVRLIVTTSPSLTAISGPGTETLHPPKPSAVPNPHIGTLAPAGSKAVVPVHKSTVTGAA